MKTLKERLWLWSFAIRYFVRFGRTLRKSKMSPFYRHLREHREDSVRSAITWHTMYRLRVRTQLRITVRLLSIVLVCAVAAMVQDTQYRDLFLLLFALSWTALILQMLFGLHATVQD